jgi:two-component system response regulator RegA
VCRAVAEMQGFCRDASLRPPWRGCSRLDRAHAAPHLPPAGGENTWQRTWGTSACLSVPVPLQSFTVSQQRSPLIVDDEEPIIFAMAAYFTHRGFAVDYACSVQEAERLAAAHHYAAVITDLQFTKGHGRQGLDLITSIRQRWPSVCFILLTAEGSPQVEAEARRRGVDAFLCKPTSLSDVEHTMCGLLASRQERPQR